MMMQHGVVLPIANLEKPAADLRFIAGKPHEAKLDTCMHIARGIGGQNAVVLLISDGLDAESSDDLAAQMERLAKSSRRLAWLNPLLRYERFEPRPAGIRAMLPYVDDFLPCHNLESLMQLATALEGMTGNEPRRFRGSGSRWR